MYPFDEDTSQSIAMGFPRAAFHMLILTGIRRSGRHIASWKKCNKNNMAFSPHFTGTFIFVYLIRLISVCALHTLGNVHKSCQEKKSGV